ncbi:MaoC family dehydratase [Paenibacillus dokdonensis]|uniref:MaoC family dehydratase n=1 Tax=Paenibacillus dokdonensis TaxID=2567944 RepID=A0ABU6GKK4_9BACL|nr:MaoC family dehydratase [Paenibacillus dokdonensis]MEC0240272.1 MaoC family dehydratase [Paenibacillus dokdonensis]
MKKRITYEAIRKYSAASKDMADIHLDTEAAAMAGFKRPIVHGMYIMGLAQSLYLREHPAQWITTFDMKFQKPLLVDSVVSFDFVDSDGHIHVTVTDETGEVAASGILSVKERLR